MNDDTRPAPPPEDTPNQVREVAPTMIAEAGTIALLNRSEIDMQIATARKYPRSIKDFRRDVFSMVSLSVPIAEECIYALPRDGKMIEGPSARFAEIVANAWGNSRAGARVVSDAGEFVTAQGVFHDLEKNVAITYEVQRRIVNKNGRRFNTDMIGVTGNAASSIALRNAILKGVPKAFWAEMYDAARKTAMGDVKTLPTRRAAVLAELLRYGVKPEQVFAKLELKGEEDMNIEHIMILRGVVTAIRDGDTTPEEAFAADGGQPVARAAGPRTRDDAAPKPPAPDAPRRDDGTQREPRPGTPGFNNGTAREGQESKPADESRKADDDFVRSMEQAEQQQQKPDPDWQDSGELASDGERKWLLTRLDARRVALRDVLPAGVGGNVKADLTGLTKAMFDRARSKLV